MEETKKQLPAKKEAEQPEGKQVKKAAKRKKKSKLVKFAESFFVEDIKSVFSWGVYEVAIPALKKLFVEFIDNTANSMMYGLGNGRVELGKRSATGNVSYKEYYYSSKEKDRERGRRVNYDTVHRDIYSYGCTEVPTRERARSIVDHMEEHLVRYGYVTVAAVMEELEVHPRSTDFNYGWTRIDNIRINIGTGGWYEISFPKVMEISSD